MQPPPPSPRLRVVMLLAGLLVLAACSASGSSPASSPAPSSPPTSIDSPAAAARLVAERSPLFAGIEAKDPDLVGQGSWWEAKPIAGGGYRVTFRVGWGDCPAGCIDEHTWTWDVATDGSTTFVEEAGPELPPAVVAQLRAAATGHTGVAGRVTAGPVCPVETPDEPCADRAVAGAVLVVQGVGGAEVARVTTDAAGLFRVALQPGDYTLAPQPVEGLMGTASPLPFSVADGTETFLDVAYDTGIR